MCSKHVVRAELAQHVCSTLHVVKELKSHDSRNLAGRSSFEACSVLCRQRFIGTRRSHRSRRLLHCSIAGCIHKSRLQITVYFTTVSMLIAIIAIAKKCIRYNRS